MNKRIIGIFATLALQEGGFWLASKNKLQLGTQHKTIALVNIELYLAKFAGRADSDDSLIAMMRDVANNNQLNLKWNAA